MVGMETIKNQVDKADNRQRMDLMFYIIAKNACVAQDEFTREEVERFAKLTYEIWIDFDKIHPISLCDSLVWMVETGDRTLEELENMDRWDVVQLAYRFGYED